MNGYYDIHCPYCGSIIGPWDVKFSITEFVQEIFNQRLDDKFNDGILGVIDEEEIHLILDNDFLWDMSVTDIQGCYVGSMFELSGENLIKRFGSAAEMFNKLTEEEVEEVAESYNINETLNEKENVRALVDEILKNVPPERLIRTEVPTEERDVAVLNLIRYAQSKKTLFKINLKIEPDKDDRGNIINKDIRSSDERIICKSKRCCNCGNELSKMAGKYEEKIVSFIGSPASGKSAYLAAAINKLLTTGQGEYGVEVIFDYQSSDYIAFNSACLLPYSKGFAIVKTNQDTFPQLSMALKNSKLDKTYLYTFVDIPGETFIDENGCNVGDLLANRRIIKHADVVWYCVSAKQLFSSKIGRVRRARSEGYIENEEMDDLRILGQNTIKFANEMFDDEDKMPAVALVLTKSDLLSNFIMENVFSGDINKNRLLKKEYFKTICAAPQHSYSDDGEDYDYYDGEPNTLGYMQEGKLIYQRFMNDAKRTIDFVKNYGEPTAEVFMGNVATAFNKKVCPCFSEASYGRSPVEKYTMDVAMKYLLAHKDRLMPRDYEDILDIFGEDAIAAFENGEGRLPVIKEQEDVNYIQNLYKRLNPVYPFGIMSILEWTFAYTGFIGCVETDGDSWNDVPTEGDVFGELKSRLILEKDGPVLQGRMDFEPLRTEEEQTSQKGGFFGGLFGRK